MSITIKCDGHNCMNVEHVQCNDDGVPILPEGWEVHRKLSDMIMTHRCPTCADKRIRNHAKDMLVAADHLLRAIKLKCNQDEFIAKLQTVVDAAYGRSR